MCQGFEAYVIAFPIRAANTASAALLVHTAVIAVHAPGCALFPLPQEELVAEGVDEGDIFPISAVTGQGVLPLVRRVRQVLDQLGPAEQVSTRCSTAHTAREEGGEGPEQQVSCVVKTRICGQHTQPALSWASCIMTITALV